MNNPSVSIITITQYNRCNCLCVLSELIKRQIYTNISEWIIVEGSPSFEDAILNRAFIEKHIAIAGIKIIYIEYSGFKIGGLRNLGNAKSTSDIIVCMDDDDYYPPERVSEAVEKLQTSNCLIGGVSDVYMYDFCIDKLYKFKGFGQYHSSNACMAYKKMYLIDNKYDNNIMIGEEQSFTENFSKQLIQFDPKKTIIVSSHNSNTFNKRELCLMSTLKLLDTLDEIDAPITDFIPPNIFTLMKKNLLKSEASIYDVVYVSGCFSRKFDLSDIEKGLLTNSETFMIKYSEYLSQTKNQKVAIYGDFNSENDQHYNGVDYIYWKKFPYHNSFKTIIMSSESGALNILPFNIDAEQIVFDYHEHPLNTELCLDVWRKYKSKVSKVLLKSEYHLCEFEKYFGKLKTPYQIIPSGVHPEFENNWDNVPRNPYQMLYHASYDKGAEHIIKCIFSIIKQFEPRAELHIYDVVNGSSDQKHYENGVMYHGIQPNNIVSRAKYASTFHIYISNIVNEIDAVHIRESIISGCIPLIAYFGVFLEMEGIRFNMDHRDTNLMHKIALHIVSLMNDPIQLDYYRGVLIKPDLWNNVCDKIYDFLHR